MQIQKKLVLKHQSCLSLLIFISYAITLIPSFNFIYPLHPVLSCRCSLNDFLKWTRYLYPSAC